MIEAEKADYPLVHEILCRSYIDNPGVNYVLRQTGDKKKHIRQLMDYSIRLAELYGHIWLSDDKKGCMLMLYPFLEKVTLTTLWMDLKLICTGIGPVNFLKVIKREQQLRERQPKGLVAYIWFIAVEPKVQRKGIGSKLLREVVTYTDRNGLQVIMETNSSTLAWYLRSGFKKYDELQLSFTLHFLTYIPDTHTPLVIDHT